MINYTCELADVCLSDYWSGHHKAHLAIPVDNTTTLEDVKDSLLADLGGMAIAGSVDWKTLESDDFHNAAQKAIKAIEANTNGPVFPELETSLEDDSEPVIAFFVLTPTN